MFGFLMFKFVCFLGLIVLELIKLIFNVLLWILGLLNFVVLVFVVVGVLDRRLV